MRILIATSILTLACAAFPQDRDSAWWKMAAQAVQQSKLTLPGSEPFHLRAEIIETTEPDSDYQAKIEEYWVSPEKWQRTIQSPGFSQTLIVNGDKILEQDEGDYFPWWLDNLVTSMVDPLPAVPLPDLGSSHAGNQDDPRVTSMCVNVQLDRWGFCFDTHRNLLTSAFSIITGRGAEFKEYKDFGKKHVPRKIVMDPEPGTTIVLTITQLVELQQPDEQMFSIKQPTLVADRIARVRVDETTLRTLVLNNTEIDWPTVTNGLTKGGCAVYVSVDRAGHMREVWPGGCDNNELVVPLLDKVGKWRLKTATSNGVPVQVEARLTFPFTTTINSSPPPEVPKQ
jgi:hypothetical protein